MTKKAEEREEYRRRDTRQRQLVLQAVRSHRDHPTADSIYLDVLSRDSHISRATVYRNLKCLGDTEEILRIEVPGADRFDLRTEEHYHFLCIRCGALTDVPNDYRKDWDRQTEKRMKGYLVIRHKTVFEGVCPLCRKTVGVPQDNGAGRGKDGKSKIKDEESKGERK